MNPFMAFECLGDIVESTYKTIYTGCGTEFGICIHRLVHILEKLADAGMIENVTKKRIEKAIISIGKKEIQEMIDEGKEIEVKCHFCNTDYHYSVDELKELLKKSR